MGALQIYVDDADDDMMLMSWYFIKTANII